MNVARLMRGAKTFVLRFVRTSFRGLGLDQRLRLIDLNARNGPIYPPHTGKIVDTALGGDVRHQGLCLRQHLPRLRRVAELPIRHGQYSAGLGAGVSWRAIERPFSPSYG